ncbi:hypothetical protein [Phaffia rhodozyma]|uniref:Uncharacterized protein n=1 Tax=Phaffia rhodozyma TaxID=264483 RepID=A0A0F7SU74_PHARH|nr:hypothetical protein [Phaffia rhodozyma]
MMVVALERTYPSTKVKRTTKKEQTRTKGRRRKDKNQGRGQKGNGKGRAYLFPSTLNVNVCLKNCAV